MARSQPSRSPLSATLATLSASAFIALSWAPAASANLQNSPKRLVDQAWQIVYRDYAHPHFDRDAWRQKRQSLLSRAYRSKQQAYRAIRKALNSLNDPHTRFLAPTAFDSLRNRTQGERSGVGLRFQRDRQASTPIVRDVLKGSPAQAADIRTGDRLVAIDGRTARSLSAKQAIQRLRGRPGTEVTLQLARPDQGRQQLTLTRERIEVPAVRYRIRQVDGTAIGYIRLQAFNDNAVGEMHQAIADLNAQGVAGFVLDLRGNPGGLLEAGVDIARLWLDGGEIVRVANGKDPDRRFRAREPALTDRPLAVLVDGESASASEILAGALKDHNRAVIVGTPTYGKGTVQSVRELADGSGLAVTVSRFYSPDGTDIAADGITPDRKVVRLPPRGKRSDGGRDNQYERAVAALTERIQQSDEVAAGTPPSLGQ